MVTRYGQKQAAFRYHIHLVLSGDDHDIINKLFLLIFFLVLAVFIVFSSVPNYCLSKRQQNWKADGEKQRNVDGVPARKKKINHITVRVRDCT